MTSFRLIMNKRASLVDMMAQGTICCGSAGGRRGTKAGQEVVVGRVRMRMADTLGISTPHDTAKDGDGTDDGCGGANEGYSAVAAERHHESRMPSSSQALQTATSSQQAPSSPPPLSIDSLTDPLLMHIAGMLGPSGEIRACHMGPAEFLSDITSMLELCHRWKKVVRSSMICGGLSASGAGA